MKTYKFALSLILILACTDVWASQILKPAFKTVTLKEFTTLSLSVMPDAGTQLIFPFQLDNPELSPPLKIRLTNKNGFSVPSTDDELKNLIVGQNTITILGLVNPTSTKSIYASNLFIKVGGYNLSIALKTTLRPKEHVSNIVFKLKDTDRNHMVESLVKRRTKELEKQYKDKLSNIDDRAKDQSLIHIAAIAREKKKTQRFKDEAKVMIDGSNIVIYIDKFESYGREYGVLLFELENHSSKNFDINNVEIYAIDSQSEIPVKGAFKCRGDLDADSEVKCSFATRNTRLATIKKLRFILTTDRGRGEISW